jgi:hypothetical protein
VLVSTIPTEVVMILTSEMEILLAIALNKGASKKLLNSSRDVISEYFFNSLVRRGYIKGNRVMGYKLTTMGKTTLIKLLHEKESRAKTAIKQLKQLGIECTNKIDELRKERLAVN